MKREREGRENTGEVFKMGDGSGLENTRIYDLRGDEKGQIEDKSRKKTWEFEEK